MDLSNYLETMKNLPDRFSNLAFWRGVRKLKDEIVKTFENVEIWGTLVENNLESLSSQIESLNENLSTIGTTAGNAMSKAQSAYSRINNSFSVHNITMSSNTAPTIYPYTVTEGQVPYPRVEQCIMRVDSNDTSTVTPADIIENAYFTGNFTVNGTTMVFNQPMPLIPVYYQSTLIFLTTPISFYKTSSSMSISNVNFTITVRCRKMALK